MSVVNKGRPLKKRPQVKMILEKKRNSKDSKETENALDSKMAEDSLDEKITTIGEGHFAFFCIFSSSYILPFPFP